MLPALNPDSIEFLISELKKITGMEFNHYQKSFLEKRIYYRMKHLNIEQYQQYINYIHSNPDEIDLFLDKFTINYTYFFRNFNVFESFEKFLRIYVKDLKRPIKIWSAPCATGDEPYTIAMMLDQFKNTTNNFPDFKIVASDIDKNALEIAKKGIYGEYAIHETPNMLIDAYFSKQDTNFGPKYILDKKIRDKVIFLQEDIIKGHQSNEKYDVIFCRNFIIYINKYAREKLMRVLESRLHNGGLLVLGGSESFLPQNTCFETINIRDRFYIKNLSSQDEKFKQKIYSSFQSTKVREKRKNIDNDESRIRNKELNTSELGEKRRLRRENTIVNEIEINNSNNKGIPNTLTDSKRVNLNTKKQTENPVALAARTPNGLKIKNTEPAELRITDIVVNNTYNSFVPENKKKPSTSFNPKPFDKIIPSKIERLETKLKKKEEELNSREVVLKRQEVTLEQKYVYIQKEREKLEKQRKKIQTLVKNIKEREQEVDNKIESLEQFKKRLEKREQVIEQKERQLQDRLNKIGNYSRQIIQRDIQINIKSKEIELREEETDIISPFDEKRYDRVEKVNDKKEYIIPTGYYGLINSFDRDIDGTKFAIHGLGAGICLILKDPINNIFGMSHISLPDSSASKQGYHLLFPHTFADTSAKDLFNNLIYNGANDLNIRALIVGGAKLFLDYDMTYQENLDAVKKELKSLGIEIEAEDTGGLSERSVVYDTINDALYVRKSWEFQYRKIQTNI
ncbi:MAG: CheR family methyltransferase [Candidatus Hermodarchaeota archaeon]